MKKAGNIEIKNRRASFDYEFLERYTAGIVLCGSEIKSIRAGKASLVDAFCYFSGNELYVKNMQKRTVFLLFHINHAIISAIIAKDLGLHTARGPQATQIFSLIVTDLKQKKALWL